MSFLLSWPVTVLRQQTLHFAEVDSRGGSRILTVCSSNFRFRRSVRIWCCSTSRKHFLFHRALTQIKTAKTTWTRLRSSKRCGMTLVRRRSSTKARVEDRHALAANRAEAGVAYLRTGGVIHVGAKGRVHPIH